jgi:hypothetical protein
MNALQEENDRLKVDVAMLEGQVRQLSEKQSNFDQVTRFEVIGKNGRQLVEHGVSVTASLQDDDRTLKIFLTDISEIHGRV